MFLIAESFEREPFAIGRISHGEMFCGLHICAAYCPLCLQIFTEETIYDRLKTMKFAKPFSIESFPQYSLISCLSMDGKLNCNLLGAIGMSYCSMC